MLTDFLIGHEWLMPMTLVVFVVFGPFVGKWLCSRSRLTWILTGLSLLPIVLLTFVPVDRELFARCTVQWMLPTPDRVELFANVVLFVAPAMFVGIATRRPLVALLAGTCLAVVIEAIQAAVPAIGRSCDTGDWLSNSIGAAIGAALALVALLLERRNRDRRNGPPPALTGTVVHEFGDALDVVEVVDVAVPEPAEGQVVVEMLASVINPSDLITISGAYRSRVALPFVPGFEGVGVVHAVGSGVEDLSVGTRVLPIGTTGSWSSFKVSEARWCFPVPEDLSDEQAATMYINPLTAWLMLHDSARIDPGMEVIVDAAGSEIGRMLLALLNLAGVAPVAIVRTESTAKRIERFKTKSILVSSATDFERDLARAIPGSADLVLDAVGGDLGSMLRSRIAPGGHFIHYGLLSGDPLTPQPAGSLPDHRFEFFRLRDWVHRADPSEIQAALDRVGGLIVDGVIETRVDTVYPLGSIEEALARHADPGRNGKVLLRASSVQ